MSTTESPQPSASNDTHASSHGHAELIRRSPKSDSSRADCLALALVVALAVAIGSRLHELDRIPT